MNVIIPLLRWLRGLTRRTPELFEAASGFWSLVWVALAWGGWNRGALQSVDLLSRLISDFYLFCVAAGAAVLQLAALAMRDWHVPRFLAAFLVGSWYAVVAIAAFQRLGATPTLALYGMALSMNVYIVIHVLDGRRR